MSPFAAITANGFAITANGFLDIFRTRTRTPVVYLDKEKIVYQVLINTLPTDLTSHISKLGVDVEPSVSELFGRCKLQGLRQMMRYHDHAVAMALLPDLEKDLEKDVEKALKEGRKYESKEESIEDLENIIRQGLERQTNQTHQTLETRLRIQQGYVDKVLNSIKTLRKHRSGLQDFAFVVFKILAKLACPNIENIVNIEECL